MSRARSSGVDMNSLLVLGAVGLGIYFLVKRAKSNNSLAYDAGAAAAGAAGDLVTGAVDQTGTWFGLPAMDDTKCAAAVARGSMLDTLLYCRDSTLVFDAWKHPAAPDAGHGASGNW